MNIGKDITYKYIHNCGMQSAPARLQIEGEVMKSVAWAIPNAYNRNLPRLRSKANANPKPIAR